MSNYRDDTTSYVFNGTVACSGTAFTSLGVETLASGDTNLVPTRNFCKGAFICEGTDNTYKARVYARSVVGGKYLVPEYVGEYQFSADANAVDASDFAGSGYYFANNITGVSDDTDVANSKIYNPSGVAKVGRIGFDHLQAHDIKVQFVDATNGTASSAAFIFAGV